MTKFNISKKELSKNQNKIDYEFPKYTTQLLNLANQNSQGTRSNVVGQLSDLVPQYMSEVDNPSFEGWKEWYLKKYPNAIKESANKTWTQVENLRKAIEEIDKTMVRKWVEDLVLYKSYKGLTFQKSILSRMAKEKGVDYRLANPEEESKGIDGYVGDVPYQIKPESFDVKTHQIHDNIEYCIVRYKETDKGLEVEYKEIKN